MDILLILLSIAAVPVILFIGVAITITLGDRHFVQNHYEWLEVLSYPEWCSIRRIRKRMATQKKTKRSFMGIVLLDLNVLKKEGLVEFRWNESKTKSHRPRAEYRLTHSGMDAKERDTTQFH